MVAMFWSLAGLAFLMGFIVPLVLLFIRILREEGNES